MEGISISPIKMSGSTTPGPGGKSGIGNVAPGARVGGPEYTVVVGATVVVVVLVLVLVEVDEVVDVGSVVAVSSLEHAASTSPTAKIAARVGRRGERVRRITCPFSQTHTMGLWSVGRGKPLGHNDGVIRAGMIRRRRPLAIALGLAIIGTFGVACGGDGPERALTGIVRDDPLRSNGVVVTDVTDSGAYPATADRFELVARPESLLVVYFGFTNCPDICPTSLAELRVALKRIGDDAERVDLAMITVDPERDTAEILNGYVGSFVERYHVLRPSSPEELEAVESAFLASSSVTKSPDGRVEVSHTATTYVVDENGVVQVELPFGHGLDNLINDLEVLLDRVKT